MDWTQTLTTIIATLALLFGFIIYLMNRMDSNKKDTDQKIESFQKESNTKFEAMNTRFNALENRLTAIEVETKSELRNISQRLSNIENCVMPRKVFHFEESHKEDPEEPKEN